MCNGNPYPSKNLSMHSFSILNWNAWKFADKCPNIKWRAQVWMLVLLHFLRFLGILSNPKISDLKLIPPPPYITIPVLVTVTAGGWGRRQWVTGAVASCPIGVRCPVPVPSPAPTSRNLPQPPGLRSRVRRSSHHSPVLVPWSASSAVSSPVTRGFNEIW